MHANAPADVPARLEALGAAAGMSPEAVRVQAAAALDAVVHVARHGDVRRVVEVAAVCRGPAGELVLTPALRADPQDAGGEGRTGPGWDVLARRLGRLPGRGRAGEAGPADVAGR